MREAKVLQDTHIKCEEKNWSNEFDHSGNEQLGHFYKYTHATVQNFVDGQLHQGCIKIK